MTVARLDAEMTGVELTYWQAFFKIESEKARPKKPTDDD
jgi:hypothetical protein